MDKHWKLGDDLNECDNVLDSFDFDDIILALQCNEKVIDRRAVKRVFNEILEGRLQDAENILNNNLDEIIKAAKASRNQ